MAVSRRKDGRYIVTYRDKATGKQKAKYFGRTVADERAARDYNESLNLNEYTRRTPKEFESVYFQDIANAYAESRKPFVSESTSKNCFWKMRGVILPELGQLRAMDIVPARIDKYVQQRLSDGVKKTTIHRELSDINAVLNWAASSGRRYIPFNPMAGYEKPKRDDAILLPPTRDEVQKILFHAPEHLRRAIEISYYTGTRPGRELFGITFDDVDFETATLLVRSAHKGGPSYRLVPIHGELFKKIKTWFDDDGPGPVIRYKGRAVASVKKAFATSKKKAGISRRLTMYMFRHAFASSLLKQSADLKSTSEILGHSRPDTTTRIYQHTDTAMHRAAVDLMPPIDD